MMLPRLLLCPDDARAAAQFAISTILGTLSLLPFFLIFEASKFGEFVELFKTNPAVRPSPPQQLITTTTALAAAVAAEAAAAAAATMVTPSTHGRCATT